MKEEDEAMKKLLIALMLCLTISTANAEGVLYTSTGNDESAVDVAGNVHCTPTSSPVSFIVSAAFLSTDSTSA